MSGGFSQYYFGDFVLNVDARQLHRGDALIHLEPTVLKLLSYLIENRERLVEKQELLDEIWEGAFVSEAALSKAVARLRKALGDDPGHPKYVETVHTLGYRFISPVQKMERPPADSKATGAAHRSAPLRAAALAGSAVLLAIILVLCVQNARRTPPDPSTPPIRSLAVLPLDNLAQDPEQEYFVQGLHEALITDLSKLPGVRVISRQSTMRYQDSLMSMAEIARELNVEGLVEGSVLCVEDRVRIDAQLIRAAAEDHLWSNSYERELRDVLPTLGQVAQSIAQEIQVVLTPREKETLAGASPIDPAVQEAYFRGRFFLNRFSGEGARKSLVHFGRSIELNPNFAPAWSGAALAHTWIAAFFPDAPPRERLSQARAAALKAIELEPQLSEAYTALGLVRLSDWDRSGAKRALGKALDLNPNDVLARHGWGDYLTVMGNGEEGLAQVRYGYELDPFSPVSSLAVGYHLYFLGRFDESVAFAEHLLERDPWHPVRPVLTLAYWQSGMREESVAELRRNLSRRPDNVDLVEALDTGLEKSGPRGAHRALAGRLVEQSRSRYVRPQRIARHYALAGEADLAFQWLEKAYDERSPALSQFSFDPAYSTLRSDSRYESLLRRLDIPPGQSHPLGDS